MNIISLKINALFVLFLCFYSFDSIGHGIEPIVIKLVFCSLFLMSILVFQIAYFVAAFAVLLCGLVPLINGFPGDLGTVGYDYLQLVAFVSTAFLFYTASFRSNGTVMTKYYGLLILITMTICLLSALALASSNIRGEVPPILGLAVSIAFLTSSRAQKNAAIFYVIGLSMIAMYVAIGILNGYRTAILLFAIATILLLFYHFKLGHGQGVSKRYKYLIIIGCLGAVSVLIFATSSVEYTEFLRALQIRRSLAGSTTDLSTDYRITEITDVLIGYVNRDLFGIVFGVGFGAAANEYSSSARVAHNVWLTMLSRHGLLGLSFAIATHYFVLKNTFGLFVKRSSISTRTILENVVWVGGILALLDSHIRFSWSDPATIFLIAAAVGSSFRGGRRPDSNKRKLNHNASMNGSMSHQSNLGRSAAKVKNTLKRAG